MRAQDPSSNAFDTLRSMATSCYNASGISAQEASCNPWRMQMSEAYTRCIHIASSSSEQRQHILPREDDLETMDPYSANCFQPELIDHYINRPIVFESLDLAQFAAYFERFTKKPSNNRFEEPIDVLDENEEYIGKRRYCTYR